MPDDEPNIRPAVLNVPDAARFLGISEGRLRNLLWMRSGPKSFSYGKRDRRFRVEDLQVYINEKAGVRPPETPALPIKRGRGRPRKVRIGLGSIWIAFILLVMVIVVWLIARRLGSS